MSDLPSGIVTFLLTDIEDSTLLWQQEPRVMPQAVARHDALALPLIASHGGVLVKSRGEGDSLFLVFDRATDAVAAACALQRVYLAEAWETETPLRVRMAIHTGEAELRDGDYYGATVNRCARLRAIGHGSQILLSQSAHELVCDDLPDGVSTRYLGQHRLKDLQRREHVYQLCHPDLPDAFPPLKSLDALPNNLPLQLTSFVGREQEIARVRELLPKTRLLTLTGMGGGGKTRLALQIAADSLDEYPNGVWLIELDALRAEDTAPLYRAIAAALGIREAPGQTLLATISDHLRGKSLLLVLDNCEHVIEPCASAVQTLLLACPNLKILATSRDTLNVKGEITYPVPALSLPPESGLPTPEALEQYEAVKLFVERAQAYRPDFGLSAENAHDVAELCRRLDGLPLALELAAACIRVLSVHEILERLNTLFLTPPRRPRPDEPERHRSLANLIAWSYDLMTEAERAMLRRVSVFRGGWTLDAATAVCSTQGVDEFAVFELLQRLVEMSMIVVEEQQNTMRYRLLETVRTFGQEKLNEAGETESLRNRHLDYFLRLAEESEQKLTGPEQAKWLDQLEREHENLRAALAWAMYPDLRLRMAGALCRFWVMRGYYTEGRSLLEGALSRSHHASPAIRAKALNALGVLTFRLNENTVARAYLEESLEIRQQLRDEGGVAETLNNLGTVFRNLGEYERARSFCEQSLEMRRKLQDRWGTAATLNTLGMVLLAQGDTNGARDRYRECLAIYRLLGDTAKTATLLCNLAGVEYSQQHYTEARGFYEEGLTKLRELGDRDYVAATLSNLGETLHKIGEHTEARKHLCEGLELLYQVGNRNIMAFAFDSLGRIAQAECQNERAAHLFAVASTIRVTQGSPLSPSQQHMLDEEIQQLETTMGQEAFAKAWDCGRAMSLDRAVLYALEAERL